MMTPYEAEDVVRRYATAGFWLLVIYAVVTTIALGGVLYFETVVRQSAPVIECAVPVTRHNGGTTGGADK